MRTGAIFARGSCRALKWMALFGVVFALGAGSAAAQITVTVADKVDEGARVPLTVGGTVSIPDGTGVGTVAVTFTAVAGTASGTVTAAEETDWNPPGIGTLTINTPANSDGDGAANTHTVSGTFNWVVGTDLDAEDEAVVLTFTATPTGGVTAVAPTATKNVTIEDSHTQMFVWSPQAPTLEDADTVVVTLTATPPPTSGGLTYPTTLDIMGPQNYSFAPSAHVFTDSLASSVSITITAPPNDANRVDNEIELLALVTGSSTDHRAEPLSITVTDNNKLPETSDITVTAYDAMTDGNMVTSVEEGGKVYLEVTVDRGIDGYPMGEAIEVELSLSDPSLGELANDTVTVPDGRGEINAPRVMLTTMATDRLQTGTLVVSLEASGATAANGTETRPGTPFSLTVTNTTTPNITPKSRTAVEAAYMAARRAAAGDDGLWTAGESYVTIKLSDLFNLPMGGSVTADASSSDAGKIAASADASKDSVQLWPHASGSSDITVTAIIDPMSGATAATVTQHGVNRASVTFTATVDEQPDPEPRALDTDADIIDISIAGADEGTIDGEDVLYLREGDTTDVSVTVEWTNAQIRDLHAAAGSGTPAPVIIYVVVTPESGVADWISRADLGGPSQDVPDNWEAIEIAVPKLPKDSARDRDTVSDEGSFSLSLLEDKDAEDEAFTLEIGLASRGVALTDRRSMMMTDIVIIDDDEAQGLVLEQTSKGTIYEGGDDVEFEVKADPALVDLGIDVRFDVTTEDGAAVSSRAYSLSPTRGRVTGDDKLEITLEVDDNDGNRIDDDLELHAEIVSRTRDDVDPESVAFRVMDVHQLPLLTVSPMEGMVDEGGEIELTLTLDRNPRDTRAVDPETPLYTSEPIEVMLSAGAGTTAGMSDYQLPATVKFDEHNKKAPWTQEMKVTVMAREDNELDDGEMLVLDAMVAGTEKENGDDKMSHAGVSSLTIGESTGKLVWARSPEEVEAAVMAAKKAGMGDDMTFTAGEVIALEGNDLFGSAEGVSVGYTAMVEGDAVSESVSGGVVTITADSMGMAKVTITARASRPSGAVMINDQTDPREASITIALEVGLVALSIELSGPEEMNIVEGGMGGMVTATANRAVTEDTVVDLMRDRAMSSAEDADFTVEPITIMAGQMKGSTMVMAVEDNMMENDDNMAEELVLYGMAADNAGEVTGHVKFYIWDAAVPALPVIAQLLLAAFLAVGGYRRYRRR